MKRRIGSFAILLLLNAVGCRTTASQNAGGNVVPQAAVAVPSSGVVQAAASAPAEPVRTTSGVFDSVFSSGGSCSH